MTFFYDLNKRLADIGAKQQLNEDSQVDEKYMGFSKLEREIAKRGDVRDPGAVAASIGRKKYGKEKFQKAAAAGRKMGEARNPQELDYQQGPEDDAEYRRHHGLDDPDRQRERKLRATDYRTLDRLERQAVQRGKQIDEEPNEGNEFAGELAKARASGAKQFKVDGRTYPVKDGEVDEGRIDPSPLDDPITRFRKKHAPSVMKDPKGREEVSKLDTEYGERKKTAYGRGEDEDDEGEDDGKKKAKPAGEKRGRGRPKGSKRAIGAKGPTGRSKLMTREQGVEEDYDRDEYDEEGEMAKTDARTIEDAAEELQSILDDQENLPEWVQKKISLAKDYVDRARDYMKANQPEGEEMMAEKAVSKAQRRAAGIAHAAKKGDIPKSELRDASKEMAKMAGGELKKFAKTKEKGLPAKKTEEVEETTTSGNVAPAAEPAKGGKKGGMQFGKGIYDSMNRELEAMIAESMNVSVNMNSEGPNGATKSVTVTATDEDADMLASLLTRSGLGGDMNTQNDGYGHAEQVDENEPDYPTDPVVSDDVLQYAGGLNKPKSTGQTTTPIIANQDEREVAYDDDGDALRRMREMAGIQEEKKNKPDFPDIDKDGNRKETMTQAAKDKAAHEEEKVDESVERGLWSLWKRIQ